MRVISSSITTVLCVTQVLGHSAYSSTARHGLQPRVIDLSAFRLTTEASYSNVTNITEPGITNLIKRADYLDTTTTLVQQVAVGAEFRLVDNHYKGANGVGHVNFKQTVHGLDIDNTDFNINVSPSLLSLLRISGSNPSVLPSEWSGIVRRT
jgi:extracellular elastinolytic metalloproteinase